MCADMRSVSVGVLCYVRDFDVLRGMFRVEILIADCCGVVLCVCFDVCFK